MQPEIPITQPIVPSTLEPKPKSSKWAVIIVVISILVVASGVSAYFLSKNLITKTKTPQTIPTQTVANPTVILTPTPDPTANWKTYTDSQYGFNLKYPNYWILEKPWINDQSKYQTILPSFMAKSYVVSFSVPNTFKDERNQGSLFVHIEVFDNPQGLDPNAWLSRLQQSYPSVYGETREETTVNGQDAIKMKIAPAFLDIYVKTPLSGQNNFLQLSYGGNGEGGSNYSDSDNFVQQELKNFNVLLSSFKFK